MIIGITGRIATGKSTASAILERKGFLRIDADLIFHQLRKSSDDMNNEILKRFKTLDNKKILEILKNDVSAINDLNSITHKYVVAEIKKQISDNETNQIVLDVPVPVKNGFIDLANLIIVTTCSPKIQIRRIMKRDGCDKKSALTKINMQMSDENYCSLGNIVINTDNLTSSELEIVLENILKVS